MWMVILSWEAMEWILMIVPMLILFVIVYVLLRYFFKNELNMRAIQAREATGENTKAIKLRAYERLMLFCERVSIPELLLRLQNTNMSARDLKSALVLAVQQEYEHNLSQQLYVSDKLWQIVQLAKNQLIEILAHVGNNVSANGSSEEFSQQLILFINSQKKNPIETAKSAIKKEAGLLL